MEDTPLPGLDSRMTQLTRFKTSAPTILWPSQAKTFSITSWYDRSLTNKAAFKSELSRGRGLSGGMQSDPDGGVPSVLCKRTASPFRSLGQSTWYTRSVAVRVLRCLI